jgi:hypothetical protein
LDPQDEGEGLRKEALEHMLKTAVIETTETETTAVPVEVEIPRDALTPHKERESLIAKARELGISERRIANTYRGDFDQQIGEQVRQLHRLIASHQESDSHPQPSVLSSIRAALGI